MTQYYKMPGFTLANSNTSTKILITLFLVTILCGLSVALLQYYDRAGDFTQKAAEEWVLGNPDDVNATKIMPEKTFGQLVGITHEHAFSVPILIFVLLHLVALTSIREGSKITLYVVGFLSTLCSFAAPWAIHYWGKGWTILLRYSGLTMTEIILLAAILCLHEMWLAKTIRKFRNKEEPPAPNPMFPRHREGDNQGADDSENE